MTKIKLDMVFSILDPKEKRNVLTLVVLVSIGMALETLGVGIIIPIIALISNDNLGASYPALVPFLNSIGNPAHETLCVYAVSLLVSVYFVKVVYVRYLIARESGFSFGLQESLSKRLFTIYMNQPYMFHLNRNSSDLIQNILGEINIFVFKLVTPLIRLVSEGLLLTSISLLLFIVEPVGAVSAVSLLAVVTWAFYAKTKNRMVEPGKKRQFHESQVVLHLQQGLGGIKDAILLSRENNFINHFSDHNSSRVEIGKTDAVVQQLPRLWLEFFAVLGMAVIVWAMIYQGKPVGTIVPTLGVFAAAAFRLMPSVNRFIVALQSVRFGSAVVERLHADFELVKKVQQSSGTLSIFKDVLHVNHVSFQYPNAPDKALKDISLMIKRGDSVGIVGESGSGKSTLVDCILGLLEPQTGSIDVDQVDIKTNLKDWQKQIGYVSQTIYLSDDTLKRNIAYGIPDSQIDEMAVDRALKLAQLDNFVYSLPEKENTKVGERGVRLSGGQRQRIGIARALYHNPSILILDEATSSLDVATEREVMKGVYELNREKTIIIIAHRLSTVAGCKKIFHMEKGVVIKEGSPEEIIPDIENRLKSSH